MSMSLEPNTNREDSVTPDEEELTQSYRPRLRTTIITLAAVLLVIIALVLITFSLNGRSERRLFPILPTQTSAPATIESDISIIGFGELNEDPAAFRGNRIQVSGAYTPIDPPDCVNFSGPAIRWSLVAEELQLNVIGFENLVNLLDPGTDMTVTGIWDVYQGPVGCGKEPPDGTVWYLTIDRIVEPNPLFGAQAPALTVIAGEALPTLSPLETAQQSQPVETPTIEGTVELSPTMTLDATATLPLLLTGTPEATALPVTPLVPPGGTPGLTGTPAPGSTPESSPTFGPSPTPGLEGTTTPELPTSTPSGSGYPIQPSPTTTGGYP